MKWRRIKEKQVELKVRVYIEIFLFIVDLHNKLFRHVVSTKEGNSPAYTDCNFENNILYKV
jgi:hypothetical protein